MNKHKIKRVLGDEDLDVDDGFGMEAAHSLSRDDDDANTQDAEKLESENIGPSMGENGRLRLRPDIVLNGLQYSGRKTSREQVLGNSLSDGSEPENDNDDASTGFNPQKIVEATEFDYSMDDSDDDMRWQLSKDKDNELEVLNKEYEELRKQEKELLKNLRVQTSDDSSKSEAVKQQKALWDRALELRIVLQKVVTNANRLPLGQSRLIFCSTVEETRKAYEQLKTSALRTLDCLMDLQEAFIDQNAAVNEAYTSVVKDGDKEAQVPLANPGEGLDHTWKKLDLLYSRIVPYRNNSVDRWYRKTQIATGAAAIRGRLHAFDQSISQQVSAAMREPSRLIRRMQLKKSSIHVLGQPPDSTISCTDTGAEKALNELVENEVDDFDLESFDDSEFYQQLLNEFLESSDPGTVSMHAIGKLRNKKRKAVDRRASKGRKIRYNVFEPLVNFIAPEPMVLPSLAMKLFANLFGHVSTQNGDKVGKIG
ncbi:hypothetical protein O6H91_15G012000 [Diphasiastrum complanatum]|nr:hypothetical protein O6H91_15G012000 [Diphasiastrum complanatum]KAJ7528646.1 hypothetical protein O6H91_15G012000 [Diphasiastrum complanatum]KAJ7528647.1 hypothetical protein O6H91_15G012000 [Diphasiastrum complanatum]